MESASSAPPSPRCLGSEPWFLVDRLEGANDTSDVRSQASSPSVEAVSDVPSEQDEAHEDGLKSPASERLADDVLREPYQAVGLLLQLASPPLAPAVEEPSTPTAASGPYTASCGDLICQQCPSLHDHMDATTAAHIASTACISGGGSCVWDWEGHRERERLRAVSRLSGEGALEGFQDPLDLLLADAAAPGASAQMGAGGPLADDEGTGQDGADCGGAGGPVVSLGWEALASGMWADFLRELEDMQALVATTAAALWERVQDGRMALEEWVEAVRVAADKAVKSVGRSSCPLWVLLGVSGLAAVALTALATQMITNRRLASQLRQREKDLTRLVVKILDLQHVLENAVRSAPVLRYPPLERYTATTTTTTLIGMV